MIVTDADILRMAAAWARAGKRVALATVIETWGSAPWPPGSCLVATLDGEFFGSVSGGCVEGDVLAEAEEVIRTGAAKTLTYGVKAETAWRAGLACGGRISVYLEPAGIAFLDELDRAYADRRCLARVIDLDTGACRILPESGFETDELAAVIAQRRASRASGLVTWRGRRLFLTIAEPPLRLVIVGAGRIAQALVAFARQAGHVTAVVDPRAAFATPERFPDTELIIDWPDAAFQRLAPDARTAVACLSHDPKIDDPALELALRAGCAYVGALGSRRSHASRLRRLSARGVGEAELTRLHAPIGLDIGAVDPVEIAISIMAEIVLSTRRKVLRSEPAPEQPEQ